MPRSSSKGSKSKVMAIAKKLNGGAEGLLPEKGGAIRVNGTKQVVVCRASNIDSRPGRLPAHASEELRQLVGTALAGIGSGSVKEVKVLAGGKDRAGWLSGKFVVYHHPVVV